MNQLWPESFVADGNLTQTVYLLRKALGEEAQRHDYIVTVPGQGYQFIAPVRETYPGDEILGASVLDVSHPPASLPPVNPHPAFRIPRSWRLAGPLAVLLAVGAYWFYPRPKPAGLRDVKTIAVLPFEDLSGEQTEKYLGVSLADALANKFGVLQGIIVRPTRSVLKYADNPADVGKIGRELQVDAVLDGRIQRDGERIRVSVQLIRVSDNATIWTGNFDDQFTNFFAVQDSISQKVAQSLAWQMNEKERERFNRRGTENAQAYQDYLRGVYFRNKRINDNLPKAVANLEQAVQKDPNFVLAYAELAYCHSIMPEYAGTPTSESLPKAREYVTKTLELDDQIAEVHLTLASIVGQETGNTAAIEKEVKRAIELSPNDANAIRWYGNVLRRQDRYAEALVQLKRAHELDPLSITVMINIAQAQKELGNYDAAIEQLKETIAFDPNYAISHDELARVLYKKGLYREALPESLKAVELSNRLHTLLVTLCEVYLKLGERDKALAVLKELEEKYPSAASYYISYLYAQYGDKEKMYVWIERAVREKPRDLDGLNDEPRFEPYRNEPRFQELARRVNL